MKLFNKIFLAISLVLLIFFAFFVNHIIEAEKQRELSSLLLKIKDNNKFYTPVISQSLFTFDKIALEIHLSSIYLDPEVLKIDFLDFSSKINLKYDSKKSINTDVIKSVIPLHIHNKKLGVLTVYYSKDKIEETIKLFIADILEVSLLILILICLIIFYFIKSFTKSINILTDASTQIASGNLDVDINIKSNDEIGILADKFKTMKNSLVDRLHFIDQQNNKISSFNDELQKSNNFLIQSQSIADIGSWEINREKNKLICSEQLYKIFDVEALNFDADYNNFLKFIHPKDRERVTSNYKNSIKNRNNYTIEYRINCKNNIIKNIEENCMHIYNKEHTIIKTIGTIQNITEMKKKDNLIYQQSKMASMGEMIENIAHQWRQPLSVISAATTGIKFKSTFDELKSEDIVITMDHISDSVQHLSQTINDFRDFFKTNKRKTSFLINKIFEKTFTLVTSQFKTEDITIIQNINEVNFYGFENELIQVLINIINNARDELIKKENQTKLIFIDVQETDNIVKIAIKDNAGGIPEDIFDEIFESHFTTKEDNGTGVGLYMAKMIIEEHMNGSIIVKNVTFMHEEESYIGAEFKIILPQEKPL